MPKVDDLLDAEFIKKLEQLTLVSRKIFTGRMKGERRSKKRGFSVEFADYRDYSHGDDLRFIDWNAYGRLDRLFIKLFMEEEDLHVHLLLDTSESMSFLTRTSSRSSNSSPSSPGKSSPGARKGSAVRKSAASASSSRTTATTRTATTCASSTGTHSAVSTACSSSSSWKRRTSTSTFSSTRASR